MAEFLTQFLDNYLQQISSIFASYLRNAYFNIISTQYLFANLHNSLQIKLLPYGPARLSIFHQRAFIALKVNSATP